jgi:hypothetical protein
MGVTVQNQPIALKQRQADKGFWCFSDVNVNLSLLIQEGNSSSENQFPLNATISILNPL